MRKTISSPNSDLFGEQDDVAVDRGLAEFRAGRPVFIADKNGTVVALPVEGLNAPRLRAFREFCAPARPQLAITPQRAQALGIKTSEPMVLEVAGDDAGSILSLAADAKICAPAQGLPGQGSLARGLPAGRGYAAAIELAKLALGLPAVLGADVAGESGGPLVQIGADAVGKFRSNVMRSLKIAARADVPLQGGVHAQFVVFNDALGAHPTAIIIGAPDFSQPVPVRLHSACLTGDVFGSRRCDCGDQLRLALANLEAAGGGIVLYLAQEGRGLGLVNKMRAYTLQDAGLDTVDANTTLGFDDDERNYDIAARMLLMLGCKDVLLLTNNPAKVDGLVGSGINICGRLPLVTPVNADNRRYLTAKATRAGHHLDHLMAALADSDH
jgi:GTP cyclohydrolase II